MNDCGAFGPDGGGTQILIAAILFFPPIIAGCVAFVIVVLRETRKSK